MEYLNKILHGDCFELLDKLPPESIDLVVTSPPYADIKYYGNKVNVFHPDKYVDWLLPINDKIYNVLKPSGHFIINIGDKIVNKMRHPYPFEYVLRSIKETKLLYYDRYIWEKISYLPTGGDKRFNNNIEWIFHFVKDVDQCYWHMDAVKEPYAETTKNRVKYCIIKYDTNDVGIKTSTRKTYRSLNKFGKVPECVMYFNRSNVKNNIHPASFNIELPLFFIKCLTKKDDVVLDPFMGSGTTAEAALQLGRYFVGIELEQNYIDYAEKRIASYLAIEEIFD